MAIHEKGNFAQALDKAQAQEKIEERKQQSRNTQQRSAPRGQGIGGIMNMNSLFSTPMGRHTTGEVVRRIADKMREVITSEVESSSLYRGQFRVLTMDKNSLSLPMSAILVLVTDVIQGKKVATVSTLLISGSADRVPPRNININGREVQIERVAADVVTNQYYGKIREQVAQEAGVTIDNIQVEDAGTIVIPREFSDEDEDRIRRVTFYALAACDGLMQGFKDPAHRTQPFSLSVINPEVDKITARIDYRPGQHEDAVGNPVRSDLKINLTASQDANNNDIGFDQVRPLTEINGYVDLVYSAPNPPQPGEVPQPQHYLPRFILTHSDSLVNLVSMEMQLLSMAQMSMLNMSMAWSGCFLPRHGVKGLDLNDIGAIGYEVQQAPDLPIDYIDVKEAGFSEDDFRDLITRNILPEVVYSMDVEEAGEVSWLNSAFIASANGNRPATEFIIEAADNLTNGQFSRIFPTGAPIAHYDGNRIHLGYYIDDNGARRDIRDLDYLALLNIYGKSNPDIVIDYHKTLYDTNIPLEIRLERRMNILRSVFKNGLTVTGYAQRVNFNRDFIIALETACAAAGLRVQPIGLHEMFGSTNARGESHLRSYAVGAQSVGHFYHAAGGPNYGGYQSAQFQGRFGRY